MNFRREGKAGFLIRRDEASSHSHQREQSHCLQGDRLASGVGTGNDKGVNVFIKFHVQGNDFLFLDKQKRVSGVDNSQSLVETDYRLIAFIFQSIFRSGEYRIQLDENIYRILNFKPVFIDYRCEFDQYSFNFASLLKFEFSNNVINFN